MKSYSSHSLEETKEIAANWLADISKKYQGKDEALVVGLSGHLGAGKTAFVKKLAELLDIKEDITSPTFVIMKIYKINHVQWKRLIHIDVYRLERREELEALRWEELVTDPHNLILMEWPENVGLKEFEPQAHIFCEIKEGAHVVSIR